MKMCHLIGKSRRQAQNIVEEDVTDLPVSGQITMMMYMQFRKPEKILPSDIRYLFMFPCEIKRIYDEYGESIEILSEESGEAIHPYIKDAFYKIFNMASKLSSREFCDKIKHDIELEFKCARSSNLTKYDRKNMNSKNMTYQERKKIIMQKYNPIGYVRREDIIELKIFWCGFCHCEKVTKPKEWCKYCKDNKIILLLIRLENSLREKGYPDGITSEWTDTFKMIALQYKNLEKELAALKKRSVMEEQYKK
eukprot:315939_1